MSLHFQLPINSTMNKISSLCVLLLIAKEALSLSCKHCSDESGWDSCDKKVKVGHCNPVLATDLHRNLQNLNPNLPVEPPYPPGYYVYQCYELAIRFKVAPGSSSVMYERGCTFYQANFCNGWDTNILEQVNCTTSFTGVPNVDDGAVDENSDNSEGGSKQLTSSVCGWLMIVILTVSKVLDQ